MRNYHVRPQSLRLYLRVLFLSLACLSLDASAFYSSSSAGNVTTLGTGIANAQNSSKFTYGLASPLGVGINTGMGLPLPGGSLAVAVEGTASMGNVVGAVGRFMGKVVPVLVVGVALYDLARELGFTTTDGKNFTRDDNATYYQYANDPAYLASSAQASCNLAAILIYGSNAVGTVNGTTTKFCEIYTNGNYRSNQALTVVPRPAGTAVQTATPQEFLDAIKSKTDWGNASVLPRALADAIKSGEQVEVEPKTITGPATSPGTSTVTKDAVANTTTTSTTTNKYDYAGNTVTTTQVTNNITTNNSTGAVTNNTTTTTTPKAEAPTKTQCETNPTSVGCADFGTPTSDNLDKKSHAVQVFATTFTSSSGCPAPLTFNVRSLSYSIPYQPLCDRLATLRALFLVMAGFLAAWILSDSFKV